ncbi:hypothetical protein [Flavobacterium sp. 25HG05S-40]|uniref:hypothetical protein n=1 Tax=Flavobacterium sp. 25HG05S-40 TaxID=3458682 RepID=UPI004044D7E0
MSNTEGNIRRMTFEEIFESRVEYFKEKKYLFSANSINFLQSIINHKISLGVTKTQMTSFISTVDAVMQYEFFAKKRYKSKSK